MSSNSSRNEFTFKLFAYKSYIYICVCVYVCVCDLALNNSQGLICHKTPIGQSNH